MRTPRSFQLSGPTFIKFRTPPNCSWCSDCSSGLLMSPRSSTSLLFTLASPCPPPPPPPLPVSSPRLWPSSLAESSCRPAEELLESLLFTSVRLAPPSDSALEFSKWLGSVEQLQRFHSCCLPSFLGAPSPPSSSAALSLSSVPVSAEGASLEDNCASAARNAGINFWAEFGRVIKPFPPVHRLAHGTQLARVSPPSWGTRRPSR